MAANRRYPSKIIAALIALSQGRCYWPDCGVPVIVMIDTEPVFNFQIAHIAALNPTGPRYQSEMTRPERNSFSNLMLFCQPHHQYVDKIKPNEYPVQTLRSWKTRCETAEQAAALRNLDELNAGVSASELTSMMRDAMRQQAQEVKDSVAQLEASNSEAVRNVRALISRLDDYQLVGNYVDADQVTMLNEAGKNLERHFDPDMVTILSEAAGKLAQHFDVDAVYELSEAAKSLSGLTSAADQISALVAELNSPQLVNLPDTIAYLDSVLKQMPREC